MDVERCLISFVGLEPPFAHQEVDHPGPATGVAR
jgi:hypothetical protein